MTEIGTLCGHGVNGMIAQEIASALVQVYGQALDK